MSEEEASVLAEIDSRGVATVTLNRPHVNNAYDGAMVSALLDGVRALGANDDVRVIVIKGNGKHFQAGADLSWLESVRQGSPEENLAVSKRTTGSCVIGLNGRHIASPNLLDPHTLAFEAL